MIFIILGCIVGGIIAIVIVSNIIKKKRRKKEIQMLLPKAEQGDAEAQYKLSLKYFSDNQHTKGREFLAKSAENGYVQAQVWVGENLLRFEKNPSKAVDWFNKAIKQGSAKAHYLLAQCYQTGEGVEKDLGQSEKHFREASSKGYSLANRELSVIEETKRKEAEEEAKRKEAEAEAKMTADEFLNRGLRLMNDENNFIKAASDFTEATKKFEDERKYDMARIAKLNLGIASYNQRYYQMAHLLWHGIFNDILRSISPSENPSLDNEVRDTAYNCMLRMYKEGKYSVGPIRIRPDGSYEHLY